jgi:hypothetical protein
MMDSGWGYVTPDGSYYFDQNKQDFKETQTSSSEADLVPAKAYMQVLHNDFINR